MNCFGKKLQKRGRFIVFTGINGAGKSTLIDNVKFHVEGNWKVLKYPNRNTITGTILNSILTKKINVNKSYEIETFVDNIREDQYRLMSLLDNGYDVIADRYIYSTIGYNIGLDDLKEHRYRFKGLIKPDLLFIIHGDHLQMRQPKISEKYHTVKTVDFEKIFKAISTNDDKFVNIDNYDSIKDSTKKIINAINVMDKISRFDFY